MVRFQFNTGRLYTEQGQIIVVEIADFKSFESVTVEFHDVSRMISGTAVIFCADGWSAIAKSVLGAYDHGAYKGSWGDNVPRFNPKEEVLDL